MASKEGPNSEYIYLFAETKYFRVAAREYPRASRKAPPATFGSVLRLAKYIRLDAAIYYPDSTLYQLQPSFHTQSTEPEPAARLGGREKNSTGQLSRLCSFPSVS